MSDISGPLYIVDKQTKTFTTYLDFNGAGDRPGLFRKFTFERNFAIGLTTFLFDPDYARNGVFYTIHMEDPAVAADAAPRAGAVTGLDLSSYTTTPAISTPTVDGKIDREAVVVEWKDRTDDQWDYGPSDAEIYAVIEKGIPTTMMAAWDGRIPDDDIWSILNYIHALAPKK